MANLWGRKPEGRVLTEDYEPLRKHVIAQLKGIKDPLTWDAIVERIFTREELYEGPYLDEAPDIVMILKGMYKASNSLQADEIIGERPDDKIKGSHRQYGIYIARGPDIERGSTINDASIFNIMPHPTEVDERRYSKELGRLSRDGNTMLIFFQSFSF